VCALGVSGWVPRMCTLDSAVSSAAGPEAAAGVGGAGPALALEASGPGRGKFSFVLLVACVVAIGFFSADRLEPCPTYLLDLDVASLNPDLSPLSPYAGPGGLSSSSDTLPELLLSLTASILDGLGLRPAGCPW
jgi:hypothetical protein